MEMQNGFIVRRRLKTGDGFVYARDDSSITHGGPLDADWVGDIDDATLFNRYGANKLVQIYKHRNVGFTEQFKAVRVINTSLELGE